MTAKDRPQTIVFDLADEPVIAHAIFPEQQIDAGRVRTGSDPG
jgi:hypothetical protein